MMGYWDHKPTNTVASTTQLFREAKQDYAAAKDGRFRRRRQIPTTGAGADYHYRSSADFLKIMENSRAMDRDDMQVGFMVDRVVTNEIQGGLWPEPATGDKKLDEDLTADFGAWAIDPLQCDAAGVMDYAQMQREGRRSSIVDGGVLFLPQEEDQSIQTVEAHRCRTPSSTTRDVVHGVLIDKRRRPLEYWLTKDDLDLNAPLKNVNQVDRYPAFDEEGYPSVFHLFRRRRPSQTRGVSAFAPIVDPIGMSEDIHFAELIRRQITACYAVIEERAANYTVPGAEGKTGPREEELTSDGSTRVTEGISPGMRIRAKPGVKLTGFAPNIPGPDFLPHMRVILQIISCNLGLPLVMALMDASETNFSGWRGAVNEARMGFRINQAITVTQFVTPVYHFKLRGFLAERNNSAYRTALKKIGPRKFFNHHVQLPAWPYIQPLEDANADDARLRQRSTSRRRIIAERGGDIREIDRENLEDNETMIVEAMEAAKRIEKKTGIAVDWHELLYVPSSSPTSVALANQAKTLADAKESESKKPAGGVA